MTHAKLRAALEAAEHWLTEEAESAHPGQTKPDDILRVIRDALEYRFPVGDGGPAYPQIATGYNGPQSTGGLTLLDYFAGQALPACIAATSTGQHTHFDKPKGMPIAEAIAIDAYHLGQAMVVQSAKVQS